MQIFDAFLYSEPFEREVLLAKLHTESELVSAWIAVENAYSIKGDWKGNSLATLVQEDERFTPFRDRLKIISLSRDFAGEYRHRPSDRTSAVLRGALRPTARRGIAKEFAERPYFYAESMQRDAAVSSLLELSGGQGWCFVSDVDELVDAADPARRDAIVACLRHGASVTLLPRSRYVFDYDNYAPGTFRSVPVVRVEDLAAQRDLLGQVRLTKTGLVTTPDPLAFEYSYCYPAEQIHRKLETFTHLDPGKSLAARALENNHSLRDPSRTAIESAHWYEKLPMREAMHPAYILDHVETLRTHIVNPEYWEARVQNYPALFGSRSGQR